MQAVILAAGQGTRMGALTAETPKPMLLLLGTPMLEWKMAMLPDVIDEVIVIVGYLSEQIEAYFGNEWRGRKILYVHQRELNGTGGAVMLMKKILSGPSLVMMGDDLYHPADLSDLTRETSAVLGLKVDDAEHYGLLEVNEKGNLARITERPHGYQTGIVNTGAYLLHPHFFDYPLVPISETEYGLPQTLALLGQDTPVRVLSARAWQPVGKPDDIPLGEAFLRKYAV